jgi:hypothetical protein
MRSPSSLVTAQTQAKRSGLRQRTTTCADEALSSLRSLGGPYAAVARAAGGSASPNRLSWSAVSALD